MPEQPRIPRLMLLRTTTADKDDDSRDGKFAPAERECRRVAVDAFRSRAAATGIEFADIADLKLRLQEAVRTQRDRHHRAAAPEPGMMEQRRQWQTRLKQVALLALQGADDALHQRLASARAKDFEATPLRINDAALGRQAEQGLRAAQVGALLLTPAALAMLDNPERRVAVGRLLVTLRRRFGVAPVLCLQGAGAQLPGEWPAVDVLPLDQAQLLADAAACATDLLARLRVLAPVWAQTRLAAPTLVLAPTEAEARALIDDPAGAFASIADPDTRSQRRKQFDALVKALRRSHPNWPDGFYAATREQWRCFGPGSQSAGELINGALHAINSALPGSREREVLQDAELVRRSYQLDEYQLADAVVMLSAPNWQNLEGTRDVARDFTSDNVRALRGGKPLQTLAIPARLAAEHPKRQAFLDDFAREMGVLGMPQVLAEAGFGYERLALRYEIALSVGEMAVGAPQAAELTGFHADIERLASALLLLTDGSGAFERPRAEAEAEFAGTGVPRAQAMEADTTKTSRQGTTPSSITGVMTTRSR